MKDNYGTSRMLLIKRRPGALSALIFLVENSFYYESATELSSDFKTGQDPQSVLNEKFSL